MQEDFLIGTLTVKETLINAALLRLPKNMSYEDKMKRVDRALEVLGLRHIQDNRIGTQMARGVSGGERRRVSIAVELISSPPIMFLDEPTSGLDAKNSQSVCDTLIELKRRRHTVIFTIHQPRSHIFAEFDRLLLLARGKVVYFGPASNCISYFTKLGHAPPLQENPADFLVDLVTIDLRDETEVQKLDDMVEAYDKSALASEGKDKIVEITSCDGGKRDPRGKDSSKGYACSIPEFLESTGAPRADAKPSPILQFTTLLKRNFINSGRDRTRIFSRIVVSTFQGILVGTTFYRLSEAEDKVQDRINDLFFVCVFLFMMSYTILPRVIADRVLFLRERANGMYGTAPYFLAASVAALPLAFFPSMIYSTLVTYLSNLQGGFNRFFYFVLICFLHSIAAESCILFVSCISRSYDIAYSIVGGIFGVFVFFGGFAVTKNNIITMWKWAYWVSFFQYSFTGMMVNEFEGRTFDCGSTPADKCYFSDGEQVLVFYDIDNRDKWQCIWILLGMIGAYRLGAYLSLRFIIKEKS
jgi:ABC-type multidrug transport system ATPase subunit/ABC-type multidrug transport system permease subunit